MSVQGLGVSVQGGVSGGCLHRGVSAPVHAGLHPPCEQNDRCL